MVVELFMFSVIIPNYNGKEFLPSCLESIDRSLAEEIIVVDNGSTDGSLEYLESLDIKLIKNKKNLGFARAVNQGISASKSNYLVVANNDLKFGKNWFKVINQAIGKWERKVGIGAYFGKVLDWEGKKIESVGLDFEIKAKSFNQGNGQIDGPGKYEKTKFIFGASGSAVVYSKKALSEAGFFDRDFFAYLEDVDLSLRLNQLGWKTLYLPRAIAYHAGGQTGDRLGIRYRLTARNWWFIILKHYPLKVFLKHFPEIIFEQMKNLLAVKNPWFMFWVIKELVIKFPQAIKKRKPINNLIPLINEFKT